MNIDKIESKRKTLNTKFQNRFVLTEKNLCKSPLRRFVVLYKANFVLFAIAIIWIFVANKVVSSDWLFFSVIAVFFLTIFISVIYAFKFVQPLLILLDYEGYERHLFSKNIALQELLLTTAITFLIGVLPTYFAYRNINESSFEYLFLNMVSVWLTCVSGGQKCMLEHARNVWISNKDR